jgi:hypothetical protein
VAEHVASSIVGFVRAVVEASPFALVRTVTPYGFDLQPSENVDGTYRLVPQSIRAVGGFDYHETRYDTFDLWVARGHRGDMTLAMDDLVTQCHSLIAAVAREGQAQDFDLTDEGLGFTVGVEPGQSYALARITLPLSYAATL